MEREAERLGIPWTSETTDEQLYALIASREDMAPESSVEMPQCYGLRWDGDRVDECRGCGMKDSCLHRFAVEHLPKVRQEMGPGATVAAVADRLKVLPESLFTAIKYASRLVGMGTPTTVQPAADISQAFDVGVDGETEQTTEESIVNMDQPPATQQDMFPGEQVEYSTPEEGSQGDNPPVPGADKPTKSRASKGKVVVKKRASKKRAPKHKAQVTDRPPLAGSAQTKSASDPVTIPKQTMDCVTHATALALQTRKWGDSAIRHQRERKRNPAVAALVPGSKLIREYKGNLYHVEVLRKQYRIVELKTEHPTLYDVMKAITGLHNRGGRKLANWSVPKFWRTALRQALHGQEETLPPKNPNDKFRKRKERAVVKRARQAKKKTTKKLARPKSSS